MRTLATSSPRKAWSIETYLAAKYGTTQSAREELATFARELTHRHETGGEASPTLAEGAR